MQTAHSRRAVTIAVAVAGLLASAGLLNITAVADDKVPLGGGTGIVVDGSYCTLATIGRDKSGALVGFTAAHCGGPGAGVVAEGAENRGPLGTVVAAGSGLDYAVIKFDAGKVTALANYDGFAINGIGADPEWHQPECKLAAATGDFCGRNNTLPGPGPRMAIRGPFKPGDDGGPVTSDNLLVGMITGGVGPLPPIVGQPPVEYIDLIKFSAILADVSANGGPGSGFVPLRA